MYTYEASRRRGPPVRGVPEPEPSAPGLEGGLERYQANTVGNGVYLHAHPDGSHLRTPGPLGGVRLDT